MELIQKLGSICIVTKAECVLAMKLQVAVVQECDADKPDMVRCISYHESKKSPSSSSWTRCG